MWLFKSPSISVSFWYGSYSRQGVFWFSRGKFHNEELNSKTDSKKLKIHIIAWKKKISLACHLLKPIYEELKK